MATSLTSVAPGDRPWHVRDAVKVAATLKVVDPGRGLEETDVAERRARSLPGLGAAEAEAAPAAPARSSATRPSG